MRDQTARTTGTPTCFATYPPRPSRNRVSDVHSLLTAALADRYRIERELGAGGMATVYLAHDLKHDRQVAIKVLRPELAAAPGPDRFLRESITSPVSVRPLPAIGFLGRGGVAIPRSSTEKPAPA